MLANGVVGDLLDLPSEVELLTNLSTICLVDAIKPVTFQRFVLVTSPKAQRYKEALKAPDVYRLCMSIWNEEELEKLWKLGFESVTKWREYYDKWGGIPRSVFVKASPDEQKQLDHRTSNVGIDHCIVRYNTDEISGIVLHIDVTQEGGYKDLQVRFASQYVEKKVIGYYCKKGIEQLIGKFIRGYEGESSFASTRGFLFEALAHRRLAGGGKFEVCLLLIIPARHNIDSGLGPTLGESNRGDSGIFTYGRVHLPHFSPSFQARRALPTT